MHIIFFPDTLEYLQKGGRIGRAAAIAGSILSLKPLMRLDEGAVVPHERTRTRSKAIDGLVKFARDFPHIRQVGVLQIGEADVAALLERLGTVYPREQIVVTEASPVHRGASRAGLARGGDRRERGDPLAGPRLTRKVCPRRRTPLQTMIAGVGKVLADEARQGYQNRAARGGIGSFTRAGLAPLRGSLPDPCGGRHIGADHGVAGRLRGPLAAGARPDPRHRAQRIAGSLSARPRSRRERSHRAAALHRPRPANRRPKPAPKAAPKAAAAKPKEAAAPSRPRAAAKMKAIASGAATPPKTVGPRIGGDRAVGSG